MRKKIIVGLIIVMLLTVFIGCNKTNTDYDQYFKNFESQQAYASVTKSFELPKGVFVANYDQENDVYVTQEGIKDTDGKYITLYGLCSDSEVYINPMYTGVLDINGDYAIVKKRVAVGSEISEKIGVVKFKGENAGKEYGFSYEVSTYVNQYTFLDNQYLVVLGHMTYTGNVQQLTYATLYDYTSANGLAILEVGKLANASLFSTYNMKEGYIAMSGPNNVRFYNFKNMKNGYFVQEEQYIAFTSDTMQTDSAVCTVYYAGNGWYIVSAVYKSTTKYDGYEMILTDETDGKNYYTSILSYKYNGKMQRGYNMDDRVVLVSNQYSDEYMRTICSGYNDVVEEGDFATGVSTYYHNPVVPLSSAVKQGYSLVYYYYYYYVDNKITWSKTFSIYDSNCERTDIDVLLPLLYVDEVGISNADPNFQLPITTAMYYNFDTTIEVLAQVEEKIGYDTVLCHSDAIIVGQFDLKTLTSMKGAFAPDGKQIIPFDYAELSPYFGEYCTGSQARYDETKDETSMYYYRIDKTGKATEIKNLYSLHNGVYITKIEDTDKESKNDYLYGLYTNDGTELLTEKCTEIAVLDSYLVDGVYITSVVVTAEDGHGVIYSLNN